MKIGKIGNYCQFSIKDAFILNSSRSRYLSSKIRFDELLKHTYDFLYGFTAMSIKP